MTMKMLTTVSRYGIISESINILKNIETIINYNEEKNEWSF